MKKLWLFLSIAAVAGVASLFFAVGGYDYKKIIFVLPSSERAASLYYYKKDGDFFLAQDLRKGLEKLGYTVEYRFRENYDNLNLGDAGNVLYFKGYYNFEHLPGAENPNDGRKHVLYLYYVEGLHPEILKEADVVASASKKFINMVLEADGVEAVYLPQFTNPERFKPADKDADKAYPVLFVGSDHSGLGRKSVDYALLAGANLSVFGKFWEKTLRPEVLKGKFIENDELYRYYANADIVLNDHREDMRYYGFVSNRIYDVTAAGGFVLTDYLPEIEEAYGDSVATYKNYYDFKEKLEYYLAHPEIRAEMVQRAQKITLEHFTADRAAQMLDGIFNNIKK